MPFVLVIAFALSFGAHGLLLFGPEVELPIASAPSPLVLELPPRVPAASPVEPPAKPATRVAAKRRPAPRRPVLPTPADSSAPEMGLDPVPEAAPVLAPAAAAEPEAPSPATGESPFPARGMIRYRVDRGDQGFMIGYAIHDWEVVDGAYRITAVTETSGLVALFRPLRIELESRGRLTAAGLVPERFVIRRKGRETGEQADFDWAAGELRMPNRPAQALHPGAQDLLSFNYQLGLTLHKLAEGSGLSITTGKKYADYRLEIVGDEDIETPAGSFRCLHLHLPGVTTTDLWLAYDRALLPVKLQHTDRKGDIFVQVATAIELSQEP